jgi:hypothetical protein
MAIFGAGSNWDGEELKEDFFSKKEFVIGWDYENAKDLYVAVSLLKAGDIIYLKANQVGSKTIRVKGIGIVYQPFINSLIEDNLSLDNIKNGKGFGLKVKWVVTDEFHINIPSIEGKQTNVRAATFYEEHLPFVQTEIIDKLFSK